MDIKREQLSAAVGRNQDVAEKLDKILSGPNDRAFLICEFEDCRLNSKGRCSIYAVQDVPKMKTRTPCASYEPRL